MQHQQHDWFMTTLVNCVKTKKYTITFAERSEATSRKYILYIYILECSMVAEGPAAEGPAAEGPAADSRPYTLANILLVILVLKTPIEVYNYILFLIYKYLRAMK